MRKEKDKKKGIFIIVGLVLLIIVLCLIGYSYSKYVSSATGTADAKVATWDIKVNNSNIVQSATFNLDESYVTWDENEYVTDGYIAPGSKGTMNIEIDASGSEVAVKYTVSLDTNSISSYEQIKIVSINGNSSNTEEYTGIINLADVDTKVNISIEIEWTNDGNHNESDTTIGSTLSTIDIPIIVTAEQYLG